MLLTFEDRDHEALCHETQSFATGKPIGLMLDGVDRAKRGPDASRAYLRKEFALRSKMRIDERLGDSETLTHGIEGRVLVPLLIDEADRCIDDSLAFERNDLVSKAARLLVSARHSRLVSCLAIRRL
jgi:hypothetical protein